VPEIRVILIEDNNLLREGIKAMLNTYSDIKAMAIRGDGDIKKCIADFKPDLILMDMALVTYNSLRAVEMIRREYTAIRIILLDLFPMQAELVEFVKAGISGLVPREASIEEFLHSTRSVAKGQDMIPTQLKTSLLAQIVDHHMQTGSQDNRIRDIKMTNREREVLGLIAEGKSNKEIATVLNIAVHTAKTHVHNMLEKLAMRSRLELATFAIKHNLASDNI